MNNVDLVKRAAMDAFNQSNPTAIMFGTVVSASPLKIQIDQKMTLDASFLILTNAVRDHTVEMIVDETTGTALAAVNLDHTHTVSGSTGTGGADSHIHGMGSGSISTAGNQSLSHTHTVTGTKTFTVKNGLHLGEAVLLLRVQGGQKFVVLDRMVIPT